MYNGKGTEEQKECLCFLFLFFCFLCDLCDLWDLWDLCVCVFVCSCGSMLLSGLDGSSLDGAREFGKECRFTFGLEFCSVFGD